MRLIPQERIQQRTVEQIIVVPVLEVVKEMIEVDPLFLSFSLSLFLSFSLFFGSFSTTCRLFFGSFRVLLLLFAFCFCFFFVFLVLFLSFFFFFFFFFLFDYDDLARSLCTSNARPQSTQRASWRSGDPPPCLGGSLHRWVPVNTHSTPVPSRNGKLWVAQHQPLTYTPRNQANIFSFFFFFSVFFFFFFLFSFFLFSFFFFLFSFFFFLFSFFFFLFSFFFFVVAQSVQPQLAAQQSEQQPEGWRFVLDTILPGYQWAPQWVPARTPTAHWGPISGKAVGGPGDQTAQYTVQKHPQTW